MPYTVAHSDPILKQVSRPVDSIVQQIISLPPNVREREMTRILNSVEYGLASKVRRVANNLGKRGAPPRDALKSALRLTLADWGLKEIKRLGRRRSVQGLGASVGSTLANIGQGITCGIASSTEAQALAVRLQGGTSSTGGMATSAGFDVARQICPGSGGGGSSAPLPPAPAPSSSIPWVPILIGGTLLVGIVVVVKMKS